LLTIPGKEKRLLEIARQQKILEELYSFLLQKKLETSISAASTLSNSRIIEPAFFSNTPIRPDKKSYYTIAFFLGLILPALIIFLAEFLNDKIGSKADIQRHTDAPILGEVGHSLDKKTLVVGKNNRKFIAEQFRILRTNLQYVLPKKENSTILVTSSASGEGKSFISTNLASVIALTGKKTVILEFDIRKPKIVKGLGLPERSVKGITNFLIGNAEVEDIVTPVKDVENLFVIPCGPLPPNPSELILNERLAVLFGEVKARFEAVIIDTAPVGLVSDSFSLGQYADVTVYIVRHNHTFKRQVQLIDELYKKKKLPNLSIVINDVSAKIGYGSYSGYGGYGYSGYGYGKEMEYFENEYPTKKRYFSTLKEFFGLK
jgi:capsular exopolysaccharide synthesis family protein